jgi:hypothetical protein
MARQKSLIKRRPELFQIDENLMDTVKLLLLDPMTGKPKYGAQSRLVERLLREWVSHQQQAPQSASTDTENLNLNLDGEPTD